MTFKTICVAEDSYNLLKAQADAADRTLGGQIRFLLRQNQEHEQNKQNKQN